MKEEKLRIHERGKRGRGDRKNSTKTIRKIKILSLEQRTLYRERKSIFARRVIFFFEGNLRFFDTNYVIRIICVVRVGKKGRGEVVSTSFG